MNFNVIKLFQDSIKQDKVTIRPQLFKGWITLSTG